VQALRDALPRSEIVHINTHGYTSDREGALLFASKDTATKDDQSPGYDLLQAADVARQDWSQVRLVVLSACATASGETRGPHNPDSMVRALTRAGVSNVVASLWNVDAEATSKLMGKFYASLKEGQSPSQALGSAQQWMQHNPEHPEWAQPYFWAAFQLYAAN
jgi:CHAT domain-containing protein